MSTCCGTGPWQPTLYLVAADRHRFWFDHFLDWREGDAIVVTGEAAVVYLDDVMRKLDELPDRKVIQYSTHETLTRDWHIAQWLLARGHDVLSQSVRCVTLGTDKFQMKYFFDSHQFPSPMWIKAGASWRKEERDALVVVKKRNGTASEGTRLTHASDCDLAGNELAELYIDGIEYSVLVYRDEHGIATFPPAWKGEVRKDLTPPWRRLRLCPDPTIDPECERRLRALSYEIADAVDSHGYMEIEYIVTPAGQIYVLEFNPRFSGIMRISAMATDIAIFSIHRDPSLRGDLTASRYAGEVPYRGRWFSDPSSGAFGTTRLTVSGKSADEVREKIGFFRRPGTG
jgi:phosphoribosylaminoimidazole carboxylase (NCAIR synthetase)